MRSTRDLDLQTPAIPFNVGAKIGVREKPDIGTVRKIGTLLYAFCRGGRNVAGNVRSHPPWVSMAVSTGHGNVPCGGGAISPDSPKSLLTKVIEAEIIPRLFLAHRDRSLRDSVSDVPREVPLMTDGESFARLFLHSSPADITAHLRSLLARGMTRERIYLDMLAPAARRLGVFWSEGECSFDDMAHGLSRIDEVLQDMRAASPPDPH